MMPSSAVFYGVMELCEGVGSTTDYIDEDMAGKSFPFIYVGESFNSEGVTKELMGAVTQTIHIYATRSQRRWADDWLTSVRDGLKRGLTDELYDLHNHRVEYQTLDMVEGTQQLIHYVIEYTVNYNIK